MIYILIIIYTIIVAFLFEHSSIYIRSKEKNVLIKKNSYGKLLINNMILKIILCNVLVFLPATLLMAFRYEFGADYYGTYKSLFESILYRRSSLAYELIEPAYTLLNKIVVFFTDKYYWALFWASILTYIILSCAIYINAKHYTLSILLVFLTNVYFDSSNIVRQIIAFSILGIAVKYIEEQNLKKYVICMIIAFLFHTSALFMIPLYFLQKFKIKNIITFILIVSAAIFGTQYINIIKLVVSNTNRYHLYVNRITEHSGNLEIGYLLLFVIAFLVCQINEKIKARESINKNIDNFYYNFIVLGVFFSILSYYIPLIARFLAYFRLALIFYLPILLNNIRNKQVRIILKFFVITTYTAYFIYSIFIKNWFGAIPYKTFLTL